MRVISNKEELIFRIDKDGKTFYKVGLAQKKQDGTWDNDYMLVQFKKGIDLKDRTKIKIKEGYIKFYKKDGKTNYYIFINDFELASDFEAMKQVSEVEQPRELPFY